MALDLGELSGTIAFDIDPAMSSMAKVSAEVTTFERDTKTSLPEAARVAAGDFIDQLEQLPRNIDGTVSRASKAWNQLPLDAKLAGIKMNTEIQAATRETKNVVDVSADRAFGNIPMAAKLAAHQAAVDIVDALHRGSDPMAVVARESGETAALSLGAGMMAKGPAAAAAAGVAIGGVLIASALEAMDREVTTDRLAAALGGNPRQMTRYGQIAGTVYANAFGDSMEDVATAVEAVKTTVDDIGGNGGLEHLTETVLNFSKITGTDVPRAVQLAQQLVTQGLAKNVEQGFDQMLAASRRVPLAVKDDLSDAVDEYGPFFSMLGYTGPQMFELLAKGSEKGMYGIDKTGDALKEFSALVTGDAARTRPILQGLGLDYGETANAILNGGKGGVEATNQVITALLNIDDPATRARKSLELFGTPLEDLGLRDVPKFLESLQAGDDALRGFEGATARAGEALNNNAATRVTDFKRSVQGGIVDFLGNEVLPDLEAFGDRMGQIFAEHPEVAEMGRQLVKGLAWAADHVLPVLAGNIEGVVVITEKLAIAFTWVGEYSAKAAGLMLDTFGWAFGGILHMAEKSLGWVPGLGGRISKAADGFDEFREEAGVQLDAVGMDMKALREKLQKPNKINIDTTEATAKIGSLLALGANLAGLGSVSPQAPRVRGAGDGDGGGGFVPEPAKPAGRSSAPRGLAPLVHVDKLVAHDYDDFVAKQRQLGYMASMSRVRRGII